MGRVKANLQSQVAKKRMTQTNADRLFSLVQPSLSYDDFAKVDMAIEAVIEASISHLPHSAD
jgi:3-hydroxyacyl-CoA dehydrogenase